MAVYIPKLLMRLSRLLERYALSNPAVKRILGVRRRLRHTRIPSCSRFVRTAIGSTRCNGSS